MNFIIPLSYMYINYIISYYIFHCIIFIYITKLLFYSPISFVTRSWYIAQAGLEYMLLSQPPKCWNSNCVLPHLAIKFCCYYYIVLRIYPKYHSGSASALLLCYTVIPQQNCQNILAIELVWNEVCSTISNLPFAYNDFASICQSFLEKEHYPMNPWDRC